MDVVAKDDLTKTDMTVMEEVEVHGESTALHTLGIAAGASWVAEAEECSRGVNVARRIELKYGMTMMTMKNAAKHANACAELREESEARTGGHEGCANVPRQSSVQK